ncbi:hypothetical protein BGX27_009609, partial [Mortierella sp. AM989]
TQKTFDKWVRPETQAALASSLGAIERIDSDTGDTFKCLARLLSIAPDSSSLIAFPRLTVLQCGHLDSSPTSLAKNLYNLPALLSVIENCPNLQVLELGYLDLTNDGSLPRLLSAIRKKGRMLQDLSIGTFAYIKYKYIPSIIWSCAAVSRLALDITIYEYSDQHTPEEKPQLQAMAREALLGGIGSGSESGSGSEFPSRQEIHGDDKTFVTGLEFAWTDLHLPFQTHDGDLEVLFAVLPNCPRLRRLTIPGIGQDLAPKVLPILTTKILPSLEHLDFRYVDSDYSEGYTSIPQILVACPGLRSVIMGKEIARPQESIQSLIVGSGNSLESVTLVSSRDIRSEDIKLILRSCPLLKKFDALRSGHHGIPESPTLENLEDRYMDPFLTIQEHEMFGSESLGWVCNDLEILRLRYGNPHWNLSIPATLRQQISRLTKLKDLRLHCIAYSKNKIAGQDGVQEALREWATLIDLEALELRNFRPLLEPGELNRVYQQWPKLRWIQLDGILL